MLKYCLIYSKEETMTTEILKEIELLYQQIQQLCLKNLAQTEYKKEDTNAYGNILNICFDLLKRTTLHQNNQDQSQTEKDYPSNLFADAYKLGYMPIDFNTKQLDILLYNSKALFDTWQPNLNPYAQLQNQEYTEPNDTPQPTNTFAIFKQIKKILKQKQNTQEIIKEIQLLLKKTRREL